MLSPHIRKESTPMRNCFDRAKSEFRSRVYLSAARDFTTFLWRTDESDSRMPEARKGLLKCAEQLSRQGFHDSARNTLRTLIKLCPDTREASRAVTVLLDAHFGHRRAVSSSTAPSL